MFFPGLMGMPRGIFIGFITLPFQIMQAGGEPAICCLYRISRATFEEPWRNI